MKKLSVLVVSLVMALSIGLLCGCSMNKSYTPAEPEQKIDNSLLKTPGTLRVGVDASNAPYAAESQGAIVGIDVDVAAALADELGVKLELVDVGSNASDAFTADNVDIVMGVAAAEDGMWASNPYLTSSIVLFALDETKSAPSKDDVFTVAAQASSMSAVEVTNRLGGDCLEATSDIQTAFDNLKSGQVNFVATDSTIGSYVAHSSGMTIYPIALLDEEKNYCIGVPSTKAGLQNAISDALQQLRQGGVLSVITKKWLGGEMDLTSLTLIEAPAEEPAEGADGAATATALTTSDLRGTSED